MAGYFLNIEIGYYEGDKISDNDQEVPRRPSGDEVFINGGWQISQEILKERAIATSIAQYKAQKEREAEDLEKIGSIAEAIDIRIKYGLL